MTGASSSKTLAFACTWTSPSTVVVTEEQGPGRAPRRDPPDAIDAKQRYARDATDQCQRIPIAPALRNYTPTRTRSDGPPEGAGALSVHVYWKCVDGRLAANVLLNFFSGARTMRCGSGNLRPFLAYWIVAGRFRSALFSTTPVLII